MNIGEIHREAGPVTMEAVREALAEIRSLRARLTSVVKNNSIVADHNDLRKLDYASSGHTGFASAAALSTTNGNVATNAASIGTNTTDIATNASGISSLSSSLSSHTGDGAIHQKPRMVLAGGRASMTGNAYLTRTGFNMTAGVGYQMPWAGSVRSMAWMIQNFTHSGGTDVFTFEIRKNGTALVTEDSPSYSSSLLGEESDEPTYAAGTYTFAAGDVIQMYLEWNGLSGSLTRCVIDAHVEFDS